jgi:sodium-independent sulfate anion transporter 11
VITPPSQVYEFWRISPLDFLNFFIGIFVIIFVGIQEGIFATIFLSIIALMAGMFNAKGKFLGSVRIQYIPNKSGKEKAESFEQNENAEFRDSKRAYLPLDRRDGSNPSVHLEPPFPGIFIYSFTEGFNYTNAGNQLEKMLETIYQHTQQTIARNFEKKGVSSAFIATKLSLVLTKT